MQRFYFHVRLGDHLYLDPEGAEFPDRDAAIRHAREDASSLTRTARREHPPGEVVIEIGDEQGDVLATVAANKTIH